MQAFRFAGRCTTKRHGIWLAVLLLCGWPRVNGATVPRLLVIGYRDVPVKVQNDPYAVSLARFIEQLEYLCAERYSFVTPSDLRAAHAGTASLPPNAVLLSFDGGYRTFMQNVIPVLERYEAPAMLAVCSSWLERGAPSALSAPVMDWAQLAEAVRHPLVTLASHSFDLHKAVQCNPQGDTGHAVTSRRYDPVLSRYETAREHRTRLREDFASANTILQARLGVRPHIMVWPFGAYNEPALEEAAQAGLDMSFTLGGKPAVLNTLRALNRWLITGNPTIR